MQSRNPNNARGVDVSHYQGDIDWQQVREAGYCFAYVKATEGSGMVDDMLINNVIEAQAAGLVVGAYHFLRATTIVAAQREADAFLAAISGLQLDLPPVVDVETIEGLTPYDIAGVARAWIDRVKSETQLQPVIYTYPAFAQNHLDDGRFADVPLWYAYYSESPPPTDVAGWSRWTFLQTTDNGRVPGIAGPVDLNQYEGSEFDLIGYKMSKDDAEKIIAYLSASYGATQDQEARAEFHRLANELRKASGQQEE